MWSRSDSSETSETDTNSDRGVAVQSMPQREFHIHLFEPFQAHGE